MNQLVRHLFDELASLTRAGREKIFTERPVTPEVRAEVKPLLFFDKTAGHAYWVRCRRRGGNSRFGGRRRPAGAGAGQRICMPFIAGTKELHPIPQFKAQS